MSLKPDALSFQGSRWTSPLTNKSSGLAHGPLTRCPTLCRSLGVSEPLDSYNGEFQSKWWLDHRFPGGVETLQNPLEIIINFYEYFKTMKISPEN